MRDNEFNAHAAMHASASHEEAQRAIYAKLSRPTISDAEKARRARMAKKGRSIFSRLLQSIA